MASSIGWLDQSEEQQRRMREVISLFAESGTVDELGIGVVRDAFSDLLFPGLSTVQTRIRYFLFVPWIYQQLEAERVPSRRAAERGRELEVELIFSLLRGSDANGVIGREAKETLKQLPSFIYWSGLRSFGIRQFTGTRADYARSMDRFHTEMKQRSTDPLEDISNGPGRWHANLPSAPPDLLEAADLQLTADEASYLQERFVHAHPGSLLAHLARSPREIDESIAFAWDSSDPESLEPSLRTKLDTARYFSEAIHGAALLYNLRLAELSSRRGLPQGEERTAQYREQLDAWSGLIEARRSAHQQIDRHEFWRLVFESGARVTPPTRHFITEWLDAVDAGVKVDEVAELSTLVEGRERRLKKSLARLSNPRALEGWGGSSGAGQASFRWAEGRQAINDIASGLGAS